MRTSSFLAVSGLLLFAAPALRAQTVRPETWERFKAAAHANGHSLKALFRAFVLAYIRRGLADAEQDYHHGE